MNSARSLTTAGRAAGWIGSGVGIIFLGLALLLSTVGPSAPPVPVVAAILTLVSCLMGAIAAVKAPHWTLAASLTMLVAGIGVAMPLWRLMRDDRFLVMLLPAGILFLGSIFTGLGFALDPQRQWASERIALVMPLAFAGILAAVLLLTNAQLERNIEAKWSSHSVQKFTGQGKFLARWGQYGTEDGQFRCPKGIAVDRLGSIYVVDESDRVQVLDASGAVVAKFGTYLDPEREYDSTKDVVYWDGRYGSTGIAVDQEGKIYVTNDLGHTVQVFGPSGNLLTSWGSFGSGDGQFHGPMGLSVDSSGKVYVADPGNSRVQVFSSNGRFLAKLELPGSGYGRVPGSLEVAVGPAGRIYVADGGRHRIEVFSRSGNFLATWGRRGSEDGQFERPMGIAVDSSGNVYVADRGNHRVQVLSGNGKFLRKWGSEGFEDSMLGQPMWLAVDALGNVYVDTTQPTHYSGVRPPPRQPTYGCRTAMSY